MSNLNKFNKSEYFKKQMLKNMFLLVSLILILEIELELMEVILKIFIHCKTFIFIGAITIIRVVNIGTFKSKFESFKLKFDMF